jgi:3-hydroxyacyl-CoA dehydrogenase/3-hydroxy-2-methylbutyryl-CoA dehydrogenase
LTAVVVGGASGLGAATARALHGAGRVVIVVDRDRDGARALAADLPGAQAIAVDVTDDEAVGAVFDAAVQRAPVRIAVCCAGIGWAERLLASKGAHAPDAFARVLAVNLQGTFHVLRHAARVMSENEPDERGQRGVCVLTASIAAQDGQAGQVAYAASKAGVAALALPAARDLARHAVRVCAIAPGTFDTPLLASLPQAARRALADQVPWPPRLGQPDEFASLVLEVVRNPMLNGCTLRLDGALRMPYGSR